MKPSRLYNGTLEGLWWEIEWIKDNKHVYKDDKHAETVIYCVTQRYDQNLNHIGFYAS